MDSFTPLGEVELLNKILKLEEDHAPLIHQISQLTRPRRFIAGSCDQQPGTRGGAGRLQWSFKFSDRQYLNILRSVGQSVHAMDTSGRIIYWLVFPAEVLPQFPNLVQDLFHSSRLKIDNGLTLEQVDQEDTKAHERGSPIYQRRKMPFIDYCKDSSGSEKHCREC